MIGTENGKHDIMVGVSGGKDSTAALFTTKQMGFSPLAFTFDIGYYPKHVIPRAGKVAKQLNVDFEAISIKKYIRKIDKTCYEKIAELYDKPYSKKLANMFRQIYSENRNHYSAKCRHAPVFIRSCRICRRIVIRAYYAEALKHNVKAIVLGMNEWAGLSKNKFSAIRKLKPYKNKPAVYIIHLSFLLQRKISDTNKILRKLGWKKPRGESIVESNSNSCLLARAVESKARKLLGFHPDTPRLAREVTVGFISKAAAKKALNKIHDYKYSVRQVLKNAGILVR